MCIHIYHVDFICLFKIEVGLYIYNIGLIDPLEIKVGLYIYYIEYKGNLFY